MDRERGCRLLPAPEHVSTHWGVI